MTRRPFAAFGLTLALACAGPRPLHEELPTICEGESASPPDSATWIALLLRAYDPATRRATVPAVDCRGSQVRWEGPARACDDAPGRSPLPPQPLADSDVVVSPVSKDATLVWIATSHYASGDALGPVALVASRGKRLRVKALGALRAYPTRATLHMEKLGVLDVLVAEGESCASTDPATCTRSARVLPLRAGGFVAEPFRGEDGRCASPGWVDLGRRDRRRTETGWESRELTATMTFGTGELIIEEQVLVSALGGTPGSSPPRLLDRAQSTRTVRWVEGRLEARGTPLWSRMTLH